MELGSNPEPNSLQPTSSEDQELSCLGPINSIPVINVDANLPRSESLLKKQSFASKAPAPGNRSFSKVPACNNGRLSSEIKIPANEKSSKPALVLSDTLPANMPYAIITNDNLPAPDNNLHN
ncbi:hypothetical protein DSO57_1011199 [Entomophthora muscae]|uniref:Uncharacterized protein n=1 Tax=Entomophthora muscae TaxID=34485 RepID=A0ACC2UFW4_9FUNG|nr:hypothetical protein DSO57_1011199 [Entomophthora muscae]